MCGCKKDKKSEMIGGVAVACRDEEEEEEEKGGGGGGTSEEQEAKVNKTDFKGIFTSFCYC